MLAMKRELENIPLSDTQRDMLLTMENVLEQAWVFRNTPVPDRCMNPENISEVVYYFLQDKGAEYRAGLLYDRAKALSGDGSIPARRLEGMIDVLKTRLTSAVSNWYTDENGNLILEAASGGSVMKLCGEGFMIANQKNDDGSWDWRTFGTGEGFTADLIVTGFLSADRIQAHSITANHLAADVGGSLNISANGAITLLTGRTEELAEGMQRYDAYFRFDESGLHLGKQGEALELNLRNDRIRFLDEHGAEVAYVSAGRLYISDAEITNRLRVSNYAWQKMQDGSLALTFDS